MKKKMQQALKELPDYMLGYDSFNHHTPDDLAWLVLTEIDMYDEGELSEIRTKAMRRRCDRYVKKWKGVK